MNQKKEIALLNSDVESLRNTLIDLKNDILAKEKSFTLNGDIHVNYTKSARNLIQYLALRTKDIRKLQYRLTEYGISSLSRTERKVLATFNVVISRLSEMLGIPFEVNPNDAFLGFKESKTIYDRNIESVLGPKPAARRARIMVTLPSEAAWDYDLVKELVANDIDCVRINCAHDNKDAWTGMIENVKKAKKEFSTECQIYMDIPGPKLRTQDIEALLTVQRARPTRNQLGVVQHKVSVVFFREDKPEDLPEAYGVCIPVQAEWLEECEVADVITLWDARESHRRFEITQRRANYIVAESSKTTYFKPGLELVLSKSNSLFSYDTIVGKYFPRLEGSIRLFVGDKLIIKRDPEWVPTQGEEKTHYIIGCSIPSFFENIKIGDPVWLDDGKIGGYVYDATDQIVTIDITHVRAKGKKLRNGKGINLPGTEINHSALTEQDLEYLPFILEHADIVGLSFVNKPKDVKDLVDAIEKLKPERKNGEFTIPTIVFKIETRSGFSNLPHIILEGMKLPSIGVMIARGDLAIECGFGNLAELQEIILWICEAAHIPVIWATQVLESLAKEGLPTRSEITDAAMGQRAECIMLNKGAYIIKATRALHNILSSMQDFQTKKRALAPNLTIAHNFFKMCTI